MAPEIAEIFELVKGLGPVGGAAVIIAYLYMRDRKQAKEFNPSLHDLLESMAADIHAMRLAVETKLVSIETKLDAWRKLNR